MVHTVYILHSEKLNRYYTGYTNNLEERLLFHKHPESRKFTAKANDWMLFFTIKCNSKKQALSIEKHVKRMKSKKYIQNLKKYPEIIEKLLLKYQND